MKNLALILAGLSCFLSGHVLADGPRGSLLELHSCELYAGGCVVSSEATLCGRYMLRAWQFTGGEFAGADFGGLNLALLSSGSANLAAENTAADESVVYLPSKATPAQRDALLAWLRATQKDLAHSNLKVRQTELKFDENNGSYEFSAGRFVSVRTVSLESCPMGGCGESLWYSPRADSTVFTVAVDRSSKVNEPWLKLRWDEAGKRNIFLARFGQEPAGRNLFVSTAELCGPAQRLF